MATDPQLVELVEDLAAALVDGAAPRLIEARKSSAPCVTSTRVPDSIGVEKVGRTGVSEWGMTFRQDGSGDAFYGAIINKGTGGQIIRPRNPSGVLAFPAPGNGGDTIFARSVRGSDAHKGWWDESFDWGREFCEALEAVPVGGL